MASQAAEFATHRPSHWQQTAAMASKDFYSYLVFVYQYLPNWHHEVIIERLLYGGNMELILGPPDTAKTSVCLAHATWTLGRDPNFRWLIASEVASGIATTAVTEVGETIAMNERYHMVFGQLQDPQGHAPWSSHSIQFRTYVSRREAYRSRKQATPAPPWPWLTPRGRRPGLAHPNVKAVGWRSGYTGARCEAVLADDLVSDRTSRSEVLTTQVHRTLHQKLLPRITSPRDPVPGVRYGQAVMLGQRWAPRDLYSMLLEGGVVVYDNNPNREGLHVLDPEWQEAA